jgi:hypothetical protein
MRMLVSGALFGYLALFAATAQAQEGCIAVPFVTVCAPAPDVYVDPYYGSPEYVPEYAPYGGDRGRSSPRGGEHRGGDRGHEGGRR